MIDHLKIAWLLLGSVALGCGGNLAGDAEDGGTEDGRTDDGAPVPGRPCGARAGDTCRDDEYCAYEPGQSCGAADEQSVCKPRPSLPCTEEYAPVCGCDQKTYSNACMAATTGTGVLHKGVCK